MQSNLSDIIRRALFTGLSLLLCINSLHAKTVTDQLGRSIDVPETPGRVVTLAPSITEIIYYIGRQDLLVGVSRFSDYPEAAQGLPKVGSYVQLDLERIVALRPDLCIAIKDGNPKETVDRLEDLGIPVYAVNPQRLTSVLETIRELGRLFGVEDHASALASQLETRIHRIDSLVEKSNSRPGVFFRSVSPQSYRRVRTPSSMKSLKRQVPVIWPGEPADTPSSAGNR
jgi:iron complex transport system substrate-binding protein